MRVFFEKWNTLMQSNEVNIRTKIFCKLLAIGSVVGILAFLESVWLGDNVWTNIALLLMVVGVLTCAILTVQFNKIELSTIIMAMILNFDVMPAIFFGNGGIDGGAPIWFVANYFFVYLMFTGKKLWIIAGIDVISEIIWYCFFYYRPDLFTSLVSREAVVFDSLFSTIAVGLAVSLMTKFHNDTIKKQSAVVEWQKEELQKNQESQTHFFASMSHELRTPINTVIGMNEMVLRETNEAQTVEYSNKIRKSSRMLLSLINDILDMSQLETGKMTIAKNEYNTRESYAELIDMAGILAKEKGLVFEVSADSNTPTRLIGDRKRIDQVLLNLLSNAVKYTPQGTVKFTIDSERIEDNKVKLKMAVSDTGIGIRKEHLENIYDIFKRVDMSLNERVEGSGLGLAITKQLVDAMGGELTVDSIYTKGSTFTVNIIQEIADSTPIGDLLEYMGIDNQERIVYEQLFEAPDARILVVDDNITNASIVQKMLEKTRLNVDLASSGEECLKCTQNKFYHVILLDHMMPGMDGIETLGAIRGQTDGLCRHTAIVALTANAVSMAGNYYSELGFDGYLEKPIDPLLLEKTILELLPETVVAYKRDNKGFAGADNIKPAVRVRKKRVIVSCDCVAEIPKNFANKYNVATMYTYVHTKDGRFADTIEIDSDNLVSFINSGEKIYASSGTVEEYEEFFAKQMVEAEDVIHISMSSGLGISFSCAKKAAESFDHVHVIDSGQLACGQRMLTMYAAMLAANGKSYEEIISLTNEVAKNTVSRFIFPNTDMLYNTGRTTKSIHKVFEAFDLHPMLVIKNGKLRIEAVTIGDSQRCRLRFIRSIMARNRRIRGNHIFISYVALSGKDKQQIYDEIHKYRGDDVVILSQKASLSSACSSGIGSVGVTYYTGKAELLKCFELLGEQK